MSKPKIFIAVPSCREWKVDFGCSMTSLISYLTSHYHAGKIDDLVVKCQVASLLPMGREMLLNEALASGCTHMLWIDDDTKFTPECFDLLLSRDVDYIGANICRKQLPLSPTAQRKDGSVINSEGKTGIEEAEWLGLGMCLLRLDAVRNIPAPHFEVMWIKETQKYLGEDMYFCGILHEHGVKMYIDHDVSQICQHIGDFAYGYPKFELKLKEVA